MQEVFEKIIGKLENKRKTVEQLIMENPQDELDKIQTQTAEDFASAYGEAIEIVKQAAAEYNNGWIPCSKRLPERNNVVLCWVKSTTIASGETYIIGSCDNGFWFLQTYEIGHHNFPVKDYKVIAWQPLPESYQTKGE